LEEAQLTFAVFLFFSFFLPPSRKSRLHLLQERRKTKSEKGKMLVKAQNKTTSKKRGPLHFLPSTTLPIQLEEQEVVFQVLEF
jgi:hypothetical protein